MLTIGSGKTGNLKAPKDEAAEAKKEKKKDEPKGKPMAPGASRRNIIRIMGTDLDGDRKIAHALTDIKGIGYNFSRAVIHVSKLNKNTLLKDLDEATINKLETIVKNPTNYGIPSWYVNRHEDYVSGQNKHLIGSDLTFELREDINRLRKIRSYRGIRHELGLPTRGQKTKSSFRTGTSVGVQKKKDAKAGTT